MLKKVLQEDDCAPDAFEYFRKDFQVKTGMRFEEFRVKAERREISDLTIQWWLSPWVLEFCGDEPWWTLYEEVEDDGV